MKKLHLFKIGDSDKRASILFWKQAADALEVPFHAPHHTVSEKTLISSLLSASCGVLVLDDAQEFKPESLHQTLCLWRDMKRTRPTLVLLFSATPSDRFVDAIHYPLRHEEGALAKLHSLAQ